MPQARVTQQCPPYLKNNTIVSVAIFLVAITFYFVGIWGIAFLFLYTFTLFSAFGALQKNAEMSRGDMAIEAANDFQIAIKTLSTISFKDLVSRHLNFLSIVFLSLPFCLGFGRFYSLVGNDNVVLSVNSNIVQSKLIASTDAGLLFMDSSDAKVLRLLAWRPTDYFLLMPSGQVVCFGQRNITCTP